MRASILGPVLAVLALSLVACGDDDGDDGNQTDAPVVIDANEGSDGPGPDAPTAMLTCANYCSTITTNCTAGNLMYANNAECMATCLRFPEGMATDTGGNTLGCRIYHAGNAAGGQANADLHCRHAGPGGDGVCGANCLGFCTIVQGTCAQQPNPPYASLSACMTACGTYAQQPPYSAAQTGGNSFACRLYHATAATVNPATHCPHTAMVSATCQ